MAYNDLWEFDPAHNSWTQKSSLPASGRRDAFAFTIGTKAYIGTGTTYQPAILQDLWEWNQSTDTWTQKANFPGGPRTNAIAFSIGTKGYIGAGDDGNNGQKDFWEWDQATNLWTQKMDLPTSGTSFAMDGKGYVGINCSNDTLWQWDPNTGAWTFTTRFPGTPCGDMGFSNGIKAYVGMGAGYFLKEFWEYNPSGATQIKKEAVASPMRIFPNPFSNEFTLTYTSDLTDKLLVMVRNTLGQIVYTYNETHFSRTYTKTINLGGNAKGIYFVEVTCGAEHQISKIVLE